MIYQEQKLGPFKHVRTSSSIYDFRPYSIGLNYALVRKDASWFTKLKRLRGLRITWAGQTHWLSVGNDA